MLTCIKKTAAHWGQGLRLMVGMPEYSTYVTHMRNKHPDKPLMSYQQFFGERQAARFNSKVGRCC